MDSSRRISRRRVLAGASTAALTLTLAACGDAAVVAPTSSPLHVSAVATAATQDVAPAARPVVKIAVPDGTFLLDQLTKQILALATDRGRMSEAAADLTVVPLSDAGPRASELPQALEAARGSHPDFDLIVLPDAAPAFQLADDGKVLPINDLRAAASTTSIDDYLPVALSAVTDQGQMFGVPLWVAINVVQFTRPMFDRAGVVPADADGWTWNEFELAAQQLTEFGAEGPSQWGLLLTHSAAPSQQWIWQNGGAIVNEATRRSSVGEPEAVEAMEFVARLYADPVTPRLDSSAVNGLQFSGQGASLHGVPVAMMPLAVGGGFGGGSVSRTEFMVPMPDGGIAAIALDMQIVDDAQAAGQRTGVRDPDLGVMAPPKRKAAASQARLMGLISVLDSSQDPLAAYKMIEWLSAGIEQSAIVAARSPTAAQILQASRQYTDQDAAAILDAASNGRVIAGRQGGRITRLLQRELDAPLILGTTSPAEAAANAARAIDGVLAAT